MSVQKKNTGFRLEDEKESSTPRLHHFHNYFVACDRLLLCDSEGTPFAKKGENSLDHQPTTTGDTGTDPHDPSSGVLPLLLADPIASPLPRV